MLTESNVNTIVTTIGVVVVAVVGAGGFGALISRSKKKVLTETTPDEKDAVQHYAADQVAWITRVLRDSERLSARLAEAEKKADRAERRAQEAAEKLEEREQYERRRAVALSRWLTVLARAWGIEPEMPYPHKDDQAILADIIPTIVEASQPRRPKEPS